MNIFKTITFFLLASLAAAQTVPIRNPQIQGASGSIISGATLTNNGTFVNSGTINGAGTFSFGSGTVTLPATVGGLASWIGVNSITTLGTITTGTWNATPIGVSYGGSGQTSLAASIQAYLDAISTTQGTVLYNNGTDWVALAPGTSGYFLKAQGAGANPVWGSTSLSGLADVTITAAANNDFLVYNGAAWVDADASTSRTALGLGALATLSEVGSAQITDGAIVNADINASAAIDITKLASSAITIAGTSTSLGGSITASTILDSISSTQGTILYRGASGWSVLSPGTSGHFLKTQGAGANPMWDAAAGSGSVATDAIWDAAGDLAVGTGANTAARLAIGANGYVLTSNGTTAAWAAPSGGAFSTLSDVDLTGIASGDMLKWNGTDWINRTAANVRTDLGLVIGTDVQAYDADLTTYAGITPSANVQSLLGAADYAAMRTQLGLGAAALLATSTGGNGTADNGKALIFDTGGHFHATTSISVNNSSATIVSQLRPDTLLLNSTGSGSHTLGGAATGARVHSFLDADGTLAHTATTLAGYGITDAQPLDTTLTALAALNNTKGVLAQTGSDTFTRLQTPVNVKVYGATGDARKVSDGVVTSNTTVESELANFTSADVGKVIWGTVYGSGSLILPVGTIVSVTDENTIVVSDAASGTTTGVQLVIGTNDTAALVAANTAAKATSPPSALYVPSGGYIFDALIFDMQAAAGLTPVPAVIGEGSANTVFYASPSHDKVGSALFYIADGNTIYSRLSGFAIDGGDYDFGAGSDHVIAIGSFFDTAISDVRIEHVKGTTSGIYGYGYFQRLENVYVETVGGYGIASVSSSSMELINCISANCGTNSIYVSATDGDANTKSYFRMVGGWIDESPSGSLVVTGANDVTFTGVRIHGPGGDFAAEVDGTSIVSFIGCEITPWGTSGDRGGMTVASGGVVYLDNCRVDGAGTADSLTNAGTVFVSNTRIAGTGDDAINNTGTVYDGGNNTIGSVAGTALTDGASSIRSVANGGTGASSLTNLITLTTHTTGNYVADVAGTANEITSTHTPGEGSTATLSLPATLDLGGKTSFEIPNGSAPTVDAFGEIAGDNDLWAASRGAPVFFDGTAATALVNVLVSDTPSNGQVPVWNTGGTITWEANGSGSVATDTIFDAKGDLAVGTSSNTAAKLSVGTNGYVLTADSGETTGMKWAAGGSGGNWVLVSTTTISGSPSTIDFDVSTGYRKYRIELDSVISNGNGYILQLRTSTDGGSTYDSGASDYNYGYGPSGTYAPVQGTAGEIALGPAIGSDAGEGWSGEIDIYNPSATSNRPTCKWSLFGAAYNAVNYNIFTGGGRRNTAADYDHVRLLIASSQTFASGTIYFFRWSE